MKQYDRILTADGDIRGFAAAAVALAQRGCEVDGHEQAAELLEAGAGIQVSSNGNGALNALPGTGRSSWALKAASGVSGALRRCEAAALPRANRMMRPMAENRGRFDHPALAQAEAADEFISRERRLVAIRDRYRWLFDDDALQVEI